MQKYLLQLPPLQTAVAAPMHGQWPARSALSASHSSSHCHYPLTLPSIPLASWLSARCTKFQFSAQLTVSNTCEEFSRKVPYHVRCFWQCTQPNSKACRSPEHTRNSKNRSNTVSTHRDQSQIRELLQLLHAYCGVPVLTWHGGGAYEPPNGRALGFITFLLLFKQC